MENTKKKILIIGGSGGLSGCLAKKAAETAEVWILTRGVRECPEGVNRLTADRNTPDFEKAVLGAGIRWDAVFDCICMNPEHAKQDIDIISRVSDRLVVISTDSVYSYAHKKTPQTEEGVFVDESPENNTYAGNKRKMEKVFLEYFEDSKKDSSAMKVTIFRPGHIFGPGFLPGCYPEHSRQADLADRILRGEKLRLVASGIYIIQPVFVSDLADTMLDCVDKEKAFNEIFCIGGPDAVENRIYYEIIGELLGRKIETEEVPLSGYLEKYPQYDGHLCHRIYDLTKLKNAGVALPKTSLKEGLAVQLRSLGYECVI